MAAAAVVEMRTELRILSRAVEGDGNEDLDRHLTGAVKDMLRSRGMFSEELAAAKTLRAVAAAF